MRLARDQSVKSGTTSPCSLDIANPLPLWGRMTAHLPSLGELSSRSNQTLFMKPGEDRAKGPWLPRLTKPRIPYIRGCKGLATQSHAQHSVPRIQLPQRGSVLVYLFHCPIPCLGCFHVFLFPFVPPLRAWSSMVRLLSGCPGSLTTFFVKKPFLVRRASSLSASSSEIMSCDRFMPTGRTALLVVFTLAGLLPAWYRWVWHHPHTRHFSTTER